MLPFNMGATEMIFVAVVLLLVFGAKRLPELGSGLGKGIREFRRSMRDIKEEVDREDPPPQIHAPSRPQVSAASEESRPVAEPTRSSSEIK